MPHKCTYRTDGVQNYMDLKYCPCSLSLRRLGDTLSLRGKLFNLKRNHEKSSCLDGSKSLLGNDNLRR